MKPSEEAESARNAAFSIASQRPTILASRNLQIGIVTCFVTQMKHRAALMLLLPMSNKRITLQLRALHLAQTRIVQEAKRYNVVCCGRRLGKTVLGMDRLIHMALQGNLSHGSAPLISTW